MANGFLENIFNNAPPQNIFDTYANTRNTLDTLRKNKIANALSQIKLNYAPQMAQQAADTGVADLSIEQNKAKYEPILNALSVHQKQIQNAMSDERYKFLPQQLQQGIALKAQQIAELKQKILLAPQQLANKTQSTQNQTQKTQWYTSPEYNLPKQVGMQKGGAKSVFLANNQADVNNLTTNTLHAALKNSQQGTPSNASNAMPPMGAGIIPQGAPFPNIPQQPQDESAPTAPMQTPQQGAVQKSIEQQQFANQMAANKANVSAYSTKRLDNSIEMEKFLQDPEVDADMASLAKYAGIIGKGKAFVQSWKKDNPEDFERYLTAKNQLKSTFVNLQKNLEGLSVHVSQRQELIDNLMKGFESPSSNPERAWDQWQRTKQILHNVAKSNSVAAQPSFPGVREKAAGLNYDDKENLDKMVDIKVNGRRASIPLKNLHAALSRPGVEMDLGD